MVRDHDSDGTSSGSSSSGTTHQKPKGGIPMDQDEGENSNRRIINSNSMRKFITCFKHFFYRSLQEAAEGAVVIQGRCTVTPFGLRRSV